MDNIFSDIFSDISPEKSLLSSFFILNNVFTSLLVKMTGFLHLFNLLLYKTKNENECKEYCKTFVWDYFNEYYLAKYMYLMISNITSVLWPYFFCRKSLKMVILSTQIKVPNDLFLKTRKMFFSYKNFAPPQYIIL